ncbi:MAG: DUF4340 domain-containing protein [Nitrospina sp.]|nr:DUF4340 domain-containing protein [Nitrospina sp.]
MKFKGTVFMAAVFLSLIVYYFFVDLPAEQKEKIAKDHAEKLIPVEEKKVVEFSLTSNGEPVYLKRKAQHKWDLIRPFQTSGDSTEVESFISQIKSLKKIRVVEEQPKDLSIYGLNPPYAKIYFKFENKSEETLLVGNETPLGGSLYFKRENHPSVLMAASSLSNFEKSSYSFRDKTLLNFNTGSIQKIQVLRETNSLQLKKTGEAWEILGDIHTQGDKDAIMNFLQSVQFSRVKEFINESPDSLQPYGLSTPKLKLILENDKTHILSLGNLKEGKGYFARVNDSKNIVLVDPRLFKILSQKTVEFLDKTLLEFEEKDILELVLQSENETIRITQGDNNSSWNIISPIKTDTDLSTINSLLFDLKEAKIKEFIKTSKDIDETFGLNIPRRSFSIKEKTSRTSTLQLGNQSTDGQQVFAKRAGEPTVFSISKKVVDKLFRSLHELRNKKLLKFSSEEVNKILIQTPDELFELNKSRSQWDLIKPEVIKTEHIGNDLIWALKELEFHSTVTPSLATNISGLDKPSFTIRLFKNGQEKVATLKVGKLFEPEQEYLVETGNLQYRVKSKFLDSIPLSLSKFKLK